MKARASLALLCVVLAAPRAFADGRTAELLPPLPTINLFVPTSASIHGVAGAFFHTDLWASNRSYANSLTITATYYCFAGPCGGAAPIRAFNLAPRETKLYSDVVGGLFGSPETAGSIVLGYQSLTDDLTATTRTYTPSAPSPTFGTSVPAVKISEARTRALFTGVGNNGGDFTSGFRTNAGVFNPWAYTVHVVFSLFSATGAALGTTSAEVPPLSATQINNLFAAVGASSAVTANATLSVTSGVPVLHFVTVIDNQSGDSVLVPPVDDLPVPPMAPLLTNGGFDTNAAGWTATGAALGWSPTDAWGNPASGSAMITNTAATASFGGDWIAQCVAVQPGTVLNLSGRSFVSSNQATTGIVQIGATFSASANCTPLDIVGFYSQSGADAWLTDRWNPMQAVGTVPATARSAYVEVQVTKREAGGTFVAYVDDVSAISSAR